MHEVVTCWLLRAKASVPFQVVQSAVCGGQLGRFYDVLNKKGIPDNQYPLQNEPK